MGVLIIAVMRFIRQGRLADSAHMMVLGASCLEVLLQLSELLTSCLEHHGQHELAGMLVLCITLLSTAGEGGMPLTHAQRNAYEQGKSSYPGVPCLCYSQLPCVVQDQLMSLSMHALAHALLLAVNIMAT